MNHNLHHHSNVKNVWTKSVPFLFSSLTATLKSYKWVPALLYFSALGLWGYVPRLFYTNCHDFGHRSIVSNCSELLQDQQVVRTGFTQCSGCPWWTWFPLVTTAGQIPLWAHVKKAHRNKLWNILSLFLPSPLFLSHSHKHTHWTRHTLTHTQHRHPRTHTHTPYWPAPPDRKSVV